MCLVLLGALLFLNGQGQALRMDTSLQKVDSMLRTSDYVAAQGIVLGLLAKPDLSDSERFDLRMLRAGVIRASGNPLKATDAYAEARAFIPADGKRRMYLSLIQMRLAECYFDLPDFNLAVEHAEKSLELSPDSSLAPNGHAINHLILGYVDFLIKDYDAALKSYQSALDLYGQFDEPCEFPLVYTKMARVESVKGNLEKAVAYIEKSNAINDSCGIEIYDVLITQTLFQIYKENHRYRKALETSELLSQKRTAMDVSQKEAQMERIEAQYRDTIYKSEMSGLRTINEQGQRIRKQQARIIWIAVVGVIGLILLSLLLARANKRRSLTNDQLEELNKNLEDKVAERTENLWEANESIRLQAESIAERNADLTDLNHMVSHNLRGPLNNLGLLVEMLEKTNDQKEREELTAYLKPVLESLNSTANDLVDKVAATAVPEGNFALVGFRDSLERAKTGILVEMESLNAQVNFDCEDADKVRYPEKYLDSIFYNLLTNSLKYRHPNRSPVMEISTARSGGDIILKFSDNGMGIDMAKNGDKLFKLNQVIGDHPDAKGVGLYMLKQQVERSGGQIRAESELGRGTDFYVRFSGRGV